MIDPEFLIKDENKKLLNNLFYGNFKIEKEKVSSSRNQIMLNSSIPTNSFNNTTKITQLKSYNYAQKLANASKNRKNKPSLRKVERSTPLRKNKSKLRGSLENINTAGTNSSMQIAQSTRIFDTKAPRTFFERRQSDKPSIKQNFTKKLLNAKNSPLNNYFRKETRKVNKKYHISHSLRSSLESSQNEPQKTSKTYLSNYKSKVLVIDKTRKKMQPIFLLKSSKTKKNPNKKYNSTLRVLSKGQTLKASDILAHNDSITSKLMKMENSKTRNKGVDSFSSTIKLKTESYASTSLKKFLKKSKTKKKGIVKFPKKKQGEKSKMGVCVSPLKAMMFSSMPSVRDRFSVTKRLS